MVLPFALLVTGLMAYTANLGGQIRHPEIRGEALAGPNVEQGERAVRTSAVEVSGIP
jgi:hypothetical protein